MNQEKPTDRQKEALKHIRNSIVHSGKFPSFRKLMNDLNYKSPRSVSLIIEDLIKEGFLKKKLSGELQLIKDLENKLCHARTINIPILGNISCGLPILAQENIEGYMPVSINLAKKGSKYFLLHTEGDSMNEVGINDGDLVLVKQQSDAENGEKVVALIDDEATIKEIHKTENAIILKPRSSNKKHQPIILSGDFMIQGVIIATIPKN